jgi:hypothetical protein
VVAQLDSLIWVEVLFMVETMNQVSSVGSSKIVSKNRVQLDLEK